MRCMDAVLSEAMTAEEGRGSVPLRGWQALPDKSAHTGKGLRRAIQRIRFAVVHFVDIDHEIPAPMQASQCEHAWESSTEPERGREGPTKPICGM